jgi:hypothetical protein
MRKRLLSVAVVAATIVLLIAPDSGGASGSDGGPPRYNPQWLAANHSKYDTPITARYESAIRYRLGTGDERWTGAGLRVAAPLNIRMSNAGFAGNQNEFQIDINPLDHNFAIGASNDGRTSGTGYYRTSDGGRTWFAADMPGIGTSCCDPGIHYADDGTAYFINLDTSPAVVNVMKSTDNGVTWTNVSDIAVEDRPNIVVDNGTSSPFHGRIYVTWTDFGAVNEIRLHYSDNGGVSWTGPINVSNTGTGGAAYAQSSQPRVANDGTVYVGFQYYPTGTKASAQNRIAKSTNGGSSFSPNTTINAGPNLQAGLEFIGDARGYYAVNAGCLTFRHRAFPIIGVHPTNSNVVYATYAGGNLESAYSCGGLSGRHGDILFSRSVDGGATWTAPLKVNDDPSGKDQYYPWMDVAPNDKIWIGWHDRRDDALNFKHVWYVDSSLDGGLTFGPDRRVGTFRSLPTDFIGDYAGLAAENDLVLPMWWDSRSTPSGDPYTARLRG